MRSDSLSREYENRTKVPVYLYSGTILVGLLVVAGFLLSAFGSHQRNGYIDHPQVGDVYLVEREVDSAKTWYFLRVAKMHGDTAVVNHSNLEYKSYVSEFNSEDYFVAGEDIEYTTEFLQAMYSKDLIVNVFRDNGGKGFDRTR